MLELSFLEKGCEAALASRAFMSPALNGVKIHRIDGIILDFDNDTAIRAGHQVLF